MRQCKQCQKKLPYAIKIEGVTKRIYKRKYCLECSPFGEKRKTIAERYGDLTCQLCKQPFIYKKCYTTHKFCGACIGAIERFRIKKKLVDYKGGKCECCGYDRCVAALDFHHQGDKLFQIGGSHCRKFEKLKDEVDKCRLLCSNCHREQHTRIPLDFENQSAQ